VYDDERRLPRTPNDDDYDKAANKIRQSDRRESHPERVGGKKTSRSSQEKVLKTL